MDKFYAVLLLLLVIIAPKAFSQDMVTTITGVEFNAKVESETLNSIYYKRLGKPETVFRMAKSEVHQINYGDTIVCIMNAALYSADLELINQQPRSTINPYAGFPYLKDTLTTNQLYTFGKVDANLNYKGYKTAGTFTLISTFLLPPAGLITAIATSTTPPKCESFTYHDETLGTDPEFERGYHYRARKIKSHKVWINFGAAFGTTLFLTALFVSR